MFEDFPEYLRKGEIQDIKISIKLVRFNCMCHVM